MNDLFEDVKVTLENERRFYDWFLKYGLNADFNRFVRVIESTYEPARGLLSDDVICLHDEFCTRWFSRSTPLARLMKPKIEVDFIPIEQRIVAHLSQEIPVSKLTFKQQFLLNGTDVSTIPNDQIYVLIQQEETRIANLEKIQTKPKRLTAEIEEAKANLTAIVAHLDSK